MRRTKTPGPREDRLAQATRKLREALDDLEALQTTDREGDDQAPAQVRIDFKDYQSPDGFKICQITFQEEGEGQVDRPTAVPLLRLAVLLAKERGHPDVAITPRVARVLIGAYNDLDDKQVEARHSEAASRINSALQKAFGNWLAAMGVPATLGALALQWLGEALPDTVPGAEALRSFATGCDEVLYRAGERRLSASRPFMVGLGSGALENWITNVEEVDPLYGKADPPNWREDWEKVLARYDQVRRSTDLSPDEEHSIRLLGRLLAKSFRGELDPNRVLATLGGLAATELSELTSGLCKLGGTIHSGCTNIMVPLTAGTALKEALAKKDTQEPTATAVAKAVRTAALHTWIGRSHKELQRLLGLWCAALLYSEHATVPGCLDLADRLIMACLETLTSGSDVNHRRDWVSQWWQHTDGSPRDWELAEAYWKAAGGAAAPPVGYAPIPS